MIYFDDLWDLIHTIAVPLEIVDCSGNEIAYYSTADAVLNDFQFFEVCLVRNISAFRDKFQIMLNAEAGELDLPW